MGLTMFVACAYGVAERTSGLILPAPVPKNYKNVDAIQRHQEQAQHAVGLEMLETPACLQPIGAAVRLRHGDPAQWPNGSVAVWLCGLLAAVPPGKTVWTFRPEWLPRAVALACIRQGVKPVPEPVLVTSRYRDPFALLFGPGRLDRDACLRSIGLKPYNPSELGAELETLSALVALIDRE